MSSPPSQSVLAGRANERPEVVCVAGARPNFMKVAPLIRALDRSGIRPRLIHSGQHYDHAMSQAFFDELGIPAPDANLGVGSGSHVTQIAQVMLKLESELAARRPAALLVVGDVNSTLAAALTAAKSGIPVGHVEAGLRSFDRSMPEETNRILTDAISDWLFTSEPAANENLAREGIAAERVFFVGNVMIDTLLANRDRANARSPWTRFGLAQGGYALMTLHRPSNVDTQQALAEILRAARAISAWLPVLFVVHPRTRARLNEFSGLEALGNGVQLSDPLGYLDMLALMDSARVVLTDSGGIQEETTALGVQCLTVRENTERPITIERGTNRLVKRTCQAIATAAREAADRPRDGGNVPQFWDGRAAERIAQVVAGKLGARQMESAAPPSVLQGASGAPAMP